jgi:hypothetical protein
MTPTEIALIKMIMALCKLLDIDPLDLAVAYSDAESCQELYERFLVIAD